LYNKDVLKSKGAIIMGIGGKGSGLGWLLYGLETEFDALKNVTKYPFRQALRKNYQKKYNEESLFSSFTHDMRDICFWSRHYQNLYWGAGNFLLLLTEAYRAKGKRVKFITTGQQHDTGRYFQHHLDLNMTKIDNDDSEMFESKIQTFLEEEHDVLSLNGSTKYSVTFYYNIIERLAHLEKDPNTIYLAYCLFVDKKQEKAMKLAKGNLPIRFIFPEPDLTFSLEKMNEQDLNILIPYYGEKNTLDSSHDLAVTMQAFAEIPRWVFEKDHFAYLHFIYRDKDRSGFHFMNNKEKKDS